jgi:hypothetical protein
MKNIICECCEKPIYEGDEVLLIQWHDELPEIIIHKSMDCLLMLEEVSEGIGNVIE